MTRVDVSDGADASDDSLSDASTLAMVPPHDEPLRPHPDEGYPRWEEEFKERFWAIASQFDDATGTASAASATGAMGTAGEHQCREAGSASGHRQRALPAGAEDEIAMIAMIAAIMGNDDDDRDLDLDLSDTAGTSMSVRARDARADERKRLRSEERTR